MSGYDSDQSEDKNSTNIDTLNVHHHVLLQPVDHVVHIWWAREDSASEVGEHLGNFW